MTRRKFITGAAVLGAYSALPSRAHAARFFDPSFSRSATVADNAALQLGTGDFTLCGWVLPSTVTYGPTNQGTIVSKSHLGVEIFFYQGSLNAYVGGAANNLPAIGWAVDSVWYFVMLSRVGTTCKLRRVGTAPTTVTNSASISNAGTALVFGNRPGGSGTFYHGYLKNWALYNAGIDDAGGVNANSLTRGAPYRVVQPQALVEHWPLDGKMSPEPGVRKGLSATLSANPPLDAASNSPRLYR